MKAFGSRWILFMDLPAPGSGTSASNSTTTADLFWNPNHGHDRHTTMAVVRHGTCHAVPHRQQDMRVCVCVFLYLCIGGGGLWAWSSVLPRCSCFDRTCIFIMTSAPRAVQYGTSRKVRNSPRKLPTYQNVECLVLDTVARIGVCAIQIKEKAVHLQERVV